LLLLEDNAYGMFAYDGERLPTLKSLDRAGRVIYLGTFSKVLFPGLRVGFVVADQREGDGALLADVLSKVKSLTTVNTSPLAQAMVGGALIEGDFSLRRASAAKVAHYKANRDHMLDALAQCFGASSAPVANVTWNTPAGGFFLTMTLPFEFNQECFETCARDYGVIVCPMSFFSKTNDHDRMIRLSFSYVTHSMIERGVARLRDFVCARVASNP
jgi:(S)-3,5-dihydroxyphenylglycine transaminase